MPIHNGISLSMLTVVHLQFMPVITMNQDLVTKVSN